MDTDLSTLVLVVALLAVGFLSGLGARRYQRSRARPTAAASKVDPRQKTMASDVFVSEPAKAASLVAKPPPRAPIATSDTASGSGADALLGLLVLALLAGALSSGAKRKDADGQRS